MMLAWKTAACLAAGNTVVLKPAQVGLTSCNKKTLLKQKMMKEAESFYCCFTRLLHLQHWSLLNWQPEQGCLKGWSTFYLAQVGKRELNLVKGWKKPICIIHCFLLGALVGQRLSDHPDVRKLGFTGSTEVGKHIMKRWENRSECSNRNNTFTCLLHALQLCSQ